MVPSFSRRTISLPRWKISTSLLFSRNCFGSRTAWLFPDRNTRAVAMTNLHNVYTSSIHISHCGLNPASAHTSAHTSSLHHLKGSHGFMRVFGWTSTVLDPRQSAQIRGQGFSDVR
jgi:hypothetical protein